MKRALSISTVVFLALLTACGGDANQSTEPVVAVDVNGSYPTKELILQDIMDVEYIPLETNDEFINQGWLEDVGKELILIRNRNDNGDIFIYDRTGKAIRKFNRKGQSGEEYTQAYRLILDEHNNEIFVVDFPATKIIVYDLHGNFKRSFKFDGDSYYKDVFNYDRNNLITYRTYQGMDIESSDSYHILISKMDGSITREIPTPYKKVKTPVITEPKDELVITPLYNVVIPTPESWLIINTSSDTVYNFLPDGSIKPFIERSPSIQTMDKEIFLFPKVITTNHYFMRTMKKEVDYKTFKGFPGNNLVYDKQQNTVFEYTIYNDDFSDKREAYLTSNPINRDIATWQFFEAFNLIEDYNEGKLKGRLKEIAAGMNEESNPVIMLIKHKKE